MCSIQQTKVIVRPMTYNAPLVWRPKDSVTDSELASMRVKEVNKRNSGAQTKSAKTSPKAFYKKGIVFASKKSTNGPLARDYNKREAKKINKTLRAEAVVISSSASN